jgi:hypothetical protein
MNSSRGSRRLDLNVDDSDVSAINSIAKVDDSRPKRNELRELFSEEIDLIIEDEKQDLQVKIKKEMDIDLSIYKKELEKNIDDKMASLNDEKSKFDGLISAIKKSYQDKISEDISMLDELVTEITMQSLYKIIGDASAYKEIIKKNIHEVLEKKSADAKALIKVSEGEMKFLKKQFADSEWISCLRIDEKLADGEMVLDDGIASLYEIGFVNQLDVLRTAFIKLLREHHVS